MKLVIAIVSACVYCFNAQNYLLLSVHVKMKCGSDDMRTVER